MTDLFSSIRNNCNGNRRRQYSNRDWIKMKRPIKRVAAISVLALSMCTGSGIALANEVIPTGLGETHNYAIQVYARTGYYVADITRSLANRGSISARITSTKGVNVRICTGSGSALTYGRNCYAGTTSLFSNTYGSSLQTRPEAKALTQNHTLSGYWVYRE